MSSAPAQHEHDDPVMSIGVLAQKVGLSESAVRKYEREGLLLAFRTESGHRLFSHEDARRVVAIQHLVRDLGLNFEGIRRIQALLPCWDLCPCSAEERDGCAAARDATRPCWMIKGLSCAPKGNECRKCTVYRKGSLNTQDLMHLLHDRTPARSGRERAPGGVVRVDQPDHGGAKRCRRVDGGAPRAKGK